jgi:hypothetical protein
MTHPCKRAFQFIFIRMKENTLVQYVYSLLFYIILPPTCFISVEPTSGRYNSRNYVYILTSVFCWILINGKKYTKDAKYEDFN